MAKDITKQPTDSSLTPEPAEVHVTEVVKRHWYRNWLLLSIVVAVLVVLAGVGALTYNLTRKSTSQPKVTSTLPATKQEAIDLKRQSANALAQAHNYGLAQQQLSNAASAASDNSQQASIYMQKASIAIAAAVNGSGPNGPIGYLQALKYAQQAEQLAPSSQTADLLCQANYLTDHKAAAIQYCQLAISRLKPTDTGSQAAIKRYQYDLAQANALPR